MKETSKFCCIELEDEEAREVRTILTRKERHGTAETLVNVVLVTKTRASRHYYASVLIFQLASNKQKIVSRQDEE